MSGRTEGGAKDRHVNHRQRVVRGRSVVEGAHAASCLSAYLVRKRCGFWRRNIVKLVRYGRPGKEKPGLVDEAGKLRDLSAHIEDVAGATLDPKVLKRLGKLDPES